MKILKFVSFLFYKYYSVGPTSRIPYFSTLCALVLLFYIHLVQILILIDGMDLIPTDGSQAKAGNFLKLGLFMAPFFLLFGLLIKESELKKLKYSEQKIKKGYIFLIIYIIFSFAVMILLALYKKRKI